VLTTRFADAAAYRHAQAAPAEMTLLARDLRAVIKPAGRATPAWDALQAAGDAALLGADPEPRSRSGTFARTDDRPREAT